MVKKKILVVLGGNSREREISLKTGKACIVAIKKLGYKVNIFDDMEYLAESPFFNTHKNSLFTIDEAFYDMVCESDSRDRKKRLQFGKEIDDLNVDIELLGVNEKSITGFFLCVTSSHSSPESVNFSTTLSASRPCLKNSFNQSTGSFMIYLN